jgi:hypothetical protein
MDKCSILVGSLRDRQVALIDARATLSHCVTSWDDRSHLLHLNKLLINIRYAALSGIGKQMAEERVLQAKK